MSRTDFEATFPTVPTLDEREFYQEERDGYTERAKLESMDHNNTEIADRQSRPWWAMFMVARYCFVIC